MAEGLLRDLGHGAWEAASAGSQATLVRPEAVAVLREIGIEIDGQFSKTLQRFLNETFDVVVTVCGQANDACPVFPQAGRRLHWPIADPAQVRGDEETRLVAFRVARDELMARIRAEIVPGTASRARGG